jgi:hypothetical protein
MGSTAQFVAFGPFFYGGELVTAPHVFHYAAGLPTDKDCWTSRAKSATAAQPLVGDANGVASAYFDGLYKIVVKNTAETVTLYTWDNFSVVEPDQRLEGSTTWNPGSLLPGQSELSPSFTVTGAEFGDFVEVSAPYDLQGMRASAHVTAADTVKILLERPAGALRGSATWNPGSLGDGAGETSAGITVTGAAVGDAVLVYPPYDLEDTVVTGYVQAADTVEIRLQNESTGTRDLASGTWHVAVFPKGTGIDLASGSWVVRIRQ